MTIQLRSRDDFRMEEIYDKAIKNYFEKVFPEQNYFLLYPDEVEKEMKENKKGTSLSTPMTTSNTTEEHPLNHADNVVYVINAQPRMSIKSNRNFEKSNLIKLNPNENYTYNGQPVHFLDGELSLDIKPLRELMGRKVRLVEAKATYTESESDRSWRKTIEKPFETTNSYDESKVLKTNMPKRVSIEENKEQQDISNYDTTEANSKMAGKSEVIKNVNFNLPKNPIHEKPTFVKNTSNPLARTSNIKNLNKYYSSIIQTQARTFNEKLSDLNEAYEQFQKTVPMHEVTKKSSLLFDEEDSTSSFFSSTIKTTAKIRLDNAWEETIDLLKTFIEANLQDFSIQQLEPLKEHEIIKAQVGVKFDGDENNKLESPILKSIIDKLDALYLTEIENSDFSSGAEIAKNMSNPLEIAKAYDLLKNKISFNDPDRHQKLVQLRMDLNLLEKTKVYLDLGFSNQDSCELIAKLQGQMIAKDRKKASGAFSFHSESELSRELSNLKKEYPVTHVSNNNLVM